MGTAGTSDLVGETERKGCNQRGGVKEREGKGKTTVRMSESHSVHAVIYLKILIIYTSQCVNIHSLSGIFPSGLTILPPKVTDQITQTPTLAMRTAHCSGWSKRLSK